MFRASSKHDDKLDIFKVNIWNLREYLYLMIRVEGVRAVRLTIH